MKIVVRILIYVFFAISIGVHVYYVIMPDHKPFWWHCIYFLTYGTCWCMLFSKQKYRTVLYAVSAVFPFASHLYYATLHMSPVDSVFWVCVAVCVMLPLGGLAISKKII
jgi:hypothetical protein